MRSLAFVALIAVNLLAGSMTNFTVGAMRVMSDFADQLRELGPIGVGESIEPRDLKLKLDALSSLVPYVKLVEREKLRVPEKSEDAYGEF